MTMLIVCPSCATSYLIEPPSLGPAGRTVRCARCKTAWFAGAPKVPANVTGFVADVIAEAEARDGGTPTRSGRPPPSPPETSALRPAPPAADDFGAEPASPVGDFGAKPPAAEDGASAPADFPPPAPIEHETIPMTAAPSLVPSIDPGPPPEPDGAELDAEDVESFAARRDRLQAQRRHKRSSSKWTALILVLLGFNVALVGARNEVVHFVPQTASLFAAIGLPVNLRNLSFEKVRITKEEHDGVTVLVVEGAIVGSGSKPVEVPRLRFAVRNSTGQEVYSWSAAPTRSTLGPGETLPFRSQLASPPADANDLLVRFVTVRDAATGAK
jgi:predicted Zn finger-like uncharacterized protein